MRKGKSAAERTSSRVRQTAQHARGTCIDSQLGLNHGIDHARTCEMQVRGCPCRDPSEGTPAACRDRGPVRGPQLPQAYFAILAPAHEKRLFITGGVTAGRICVRTVS
jgi:hypothetical protein